MPQSTPEPCPQNVVTLSSETLVVCPGCVKPFAPRRKDQRFCSSKCRLVGYQQKQEQMRRDRDAKVRMKLREALDLLTPDEEHHYAKEERS